MLHQLDSFSTHRWNFQQFLNIREPFPLGPEDLVLAFLSVLLLFSSCGIERCVERGEEVAEDVRPEVSAMEGVQGSDSESRTARLKDVDTKQANGESAVVCVLRYQKRACKSEGSQRWFRLRSAR